MSTQPTPGTLWRKPADSPMPKDRPVIALCVHGDNEYIDGEGKLTPYGAHCEGLGHASDGLYLVEWGEGFWSDENGTAVLVPGWWFVRGSGFEIPCNPVLWAEIPELPSDCLTANFLLNSGE